MAIQNVISRSFTGANLVMVSLVEETEPKDFQNRFFMFIKAVPRTDNGSGGKSYNHKSGVTFKMEAERAFAMSFALSQYAAGKGKSYEDTFGNFSMFADASKSQYGNNSKKSMAVNYYQNSKTNKTNISIFTASDQTKIPYFMDPYAAKAFADVLYFLANECLRLEVAGPGVVVKRQISNNQQRPPQQIPQQSNQQQIPQQQNANFAPQQNTPPPAAVNQVANDFAGFLNDDLPF